MVFERGAVVWVPHSYTTKEPLATDRLSTNRERARDRDKSADVRRTPKTKRQGAMCAYGMGFGKNR